MTNTNGLHSYVSGRMAGYMLISEVEAELLAQTVRESRMHVEIGTLWGGTAILAALAGANHVITIDNMAGGFWLPSYDHGDGLKLTQKAVLSNFGLFGLQNKVWFVKGDSSYLLGEGRRFKPDTFFIDGSHSYEAVLKDWEIARKITAKAVLFHDYENRRNPGVSRVIYEHVAKDPKWTLKEQFGWMVAFERVAQ